jgi:membrane fusion protein
VALDEAAGPAMPQPLAAGMRLQADVLLERRRLVEWLFEPLLGLRQRLMAGDAGSPEPGLRRGACR